MLPDEHEYEEAKLIALISEGSEYAFQLIYDRYRNRIYHTAVRYLKSPILAQEVVQDVFLKFWFDRKNIRADQPVGGWLYTVAKNNIINRLKKIAFEWKALNGFKKEASNAEDIADHRLYDSEYAQLLRKAVEGRLRASRSSNKKYFNYPGPGR